MQILTLTQVLTVKQPGFEGLVGVETLRGEGEGQLAAWKEGSQTSWEQMRQ